MPDTAASYISASASDRPEEDSTTIGGSLPRSYLPCDLGLERSDCRDAESADFLVFLLLDAPSVSTSRRLDLDLDLDLALLAFALDC